MNIVDSVMDDLLREAIKSNERAESLLGWLHQEHREHVKDMVAYANQQITQHHAASPASTDPLAIVGTPVKLSEKGIAQALHALVGVGSDSHRSPDDIKRLRAVLKDWRATTTLHSAGEVMDSYGTVHVTPNLGGADRITRSDDREAYIRCFQEPKTPPAEHLEVVKSAPTASPTSTDPLADLDVQAVIAQIEQLR